MPNLTTSRESNELQIYDDAFTIAAEVKNDKLAMKYLAKALGDPVLSHGMGVQLLRDLRSGGIKDAKTYFNITNGKNTGIKGNQGGKITPRIN